MSELKINAFGLWETLQAEKVDVLAAPMCIEMSVDGQPLQWQPQNSQISDPENIQKGYALRFHTRVQSSSGVAVNAALNFEYDGFNWIEMNLKNVAGKKVDSMKLVIPLKNLEVPYFHVVSNFIRENPAGALPEGEGLLWDGTQLPRRMALGEETMHPQLVPYLWLGGIRRGFSFFIDCSDGFRLDRNKSSVRIIRKNDVVTLEIDLINRPVEVKDGHSFAFGMMPTPVKPVDPVYRQYTHDSSGIGATGMRNFTFIGGQLLGFIPWLRQPINQDYQLLKAVCQAVRDGGNNDAGKALDPWLAENDVPVQEWMGKVPGAGGYPQHYSRVRVNFQKAQLVKPERRSALPYKYSDPRLTFMFEEIPEYFRAEWYNPAPQSYFGARRVSLTPSMIDFLIYCYQQEFENGMHGVYLDDVYLIPDNNPDTVARMDDEGTVHSVIGILAIRELVKRVSVLQHQYDLYPRLLQVHMTNALLIPCFSLATSTLGWEQHYGETPLPQRFKMDRIMATGTGQQLGAEPCVLGGIKRKTTPANEWAQRNLELTRSLLALSLPFGAKFKAPVTPAGDARFYFSIISLMSEFGFWKSDCQFVPFWENAASAIRSDNPDWLISSWRRPGQILIIVGNTAAANSGKLTLQTSLLDLPEKVHLIDLETGTEVNSHNLHLPDYDFKLLMLK